MKIIVAVSENNGIGLNNSLPWHFREDLRYFSRITRGNGNNAIIMGRKTWDSIPKKPLPKRDNLILTKSLVGENCFSSIKTLIDYINTKDYDEVFVIGGETIYKQFLELGVVDEIYITKIHKNYECDTYFPEINKDFSLCSSTMTTENDVKIEFQVFSKQ